MDQSDVPSVIDVPINIVVKVVPILGKERELRERMAFVAAMSREEEGCLRYELFADRSGTADLYFLAEWTNQKSLDAHNQTKHVKDFGNAQPNLAKELTLTFLSRV